MRWMQLFCDANTYLPKTKGFSYIYLGMVNTSGKALWTLVSLQANKKSRIQIIKETTYKIIFPMPISMGTGNSNRVNKPAFPVQIVSTHTCGTNVLFRWSNMFIHWHTMLLSDHAEK